MQFEVLLWVPSLISSEGPRVPVFLSSSLSQTSSHMLSCDTPGQISAGVPFPFFLCESTLTSTLSFQKRSLISNNVPGMGAEGDTEISKHRSHLEGVCKHLVVTQRLKEVTCERCEQMLQGFRTILHSLQSALVGVDDSSWCSQTDPPLCML